MQCSILTTVPVHTHDHEVTCPSPSLHHIDDIMDFNVLAVYLALPPVGNLGLEPEEAVVQEDGGVGVGGAGPDDALDLESGVGAVEDEVRESGGGGGHVPGLQEDSQGAGAGVQAGHDGLWGRGGAWLQGGLDTSTGPGEGIVQEKPSQEQNRTEQKLPCQSNHLPLIMIQ